MSRTYAQKFLSIAGRLEEAQRLLSKEARLRSGEEEKKLRAMQQTIADETTKAEEYFGPKIARELSYEHMKKSKVKW